MDSILRKKKTNTFKVMNSPRQRSKTHYIFNQQTIIGSFTNLMDNEKIILALVRIKNKKNEEKTVPLGFKLNRDNLPDNIKWMIAHTDNFVNIHIDERKYLPAMLIAKGDDSKDIISSYKSFCKKIAHLNLPGLSTKINHWLALDNIRITKAKTNLCTVDSNEFDNYIKHAEILKKVQSSDDPLLRSMDHEDFPDEDLRSGHSSMSTPSMSTMRNFESQGDKLEGLSKQIAEADARIARLKEVSEELSLGRPIKYFFSETTDVLSEFSKVILTFQSVLKATLEGSQLQDTVNKTMNIRTIPEDYTVTKNDIIHLEGLLPIYLKTYKKAFKYFTKKEEEREPTAVVTNLVKYCFPSHWILNVTIKGAGENDSLLDLWSYDNPLTDPPSGIRDPDLGERRYQALLDHTLRCCARKSYDRITYKLLGNSVAKAMHYKRTQLTKKGKGWAAIFEGPAAKISDGQNSKQRSSSESDDEFDLFKVKKEIGSTPPSGTSQPNIASHFKDTQANRRITRSASLSQKCATEVTIFDDEESIARNTIQRNAKDLSKPKAHNKKDDTPLNMSCIVLAGFSAKNNIQNQSQIKDQRGESSQEKNLESNVTKADYRAEGEKNDLDDEIVGYTSKDIVEEEKKIEMTNESEDISVSRKEIISKDNDDIETEAGQKREEILLPDFSDGDKGASDLESNSSKRKVSLSSDNDSIQLGKKPKRLSIASESLCEISDEESQPKISGLESNDTKQDYSSPNADKTENDYIEFMKKSGLWEQFLATQRKDSK